MMLYPLYTFPYIKTYLIIFNTQPKYPQIFLSHYVKGARYTKLEINQLPREEEREREKKNCGSRILSTFFSFLRVKGNIVYNDTEVVDFVAPFAQLSVIYNIIIQKKKSHFIKRRLFF